MTMRVGILGDIHLDRNKRFDATIELAHRALDQMDEAGVTAIIQVGDLFEGKTTPIERAAGDEIVMRASEIAQSVWIRGNHDDPGDIDALFNLRGAQRIRTASQPAQRLMSSGLLVAAIPHVPSQDGDLLDQAYDRFRRGFSAHAGPTLLVAHVTLEGAALSNGESRAHQGMSLSPSSLLALGAQVVVAGHIHLPQSFCEGRAWHAGSIVRHDFGERDDEKGWLLVEYDVTSGPKVTFQPLHQPAMIKLEAMLTPDGWCDYADHRALPGGFEWPAMAADADIWILLHYPMDRAAEYRTMRDEAERRHPTARIEGRGIPVIERRSVEFTSAKGLAASFTAWRKSEGDHQPLTAGVATKLAEVEAAVPGFGAITQGPSAMAGEGLVLGDLEYVGINGVTAPVSVPYGDMRGIICVAGPNGGGKTTLFEASLGGLTREFGYYGTSIPARCAGAASIAQTFDMAGSSYHSELRISAKGAMEASLAQDGRVLNDPKLLRQFDEQIRAVIGTKETLELTVFARQAGPDGKAGFFDLAPADRTARIIELTGCQRYEEATKYAGDRRKALDIPIREAQATIDTLERQLAGIEGLRMAVEQREQALAWLAAELTTADEAVTAAIRAEADLAAVPEGADALRRQLAELMARREELRAAYATLSADLRIQEQTSAQRPAVEQAVRDARDVTAALAAARVQLAALEDEQDVLQQRQEDAADQAAQIAGLQRTHDDLMASARLDRELILGDRRRGVQAVEGALRLAEQTIVTATRDASVVEAEATVRATSKAYDAARTRAADARARAALMSEVPCGGNTELLSGCKLLAGARRDRDALTMLDEDVITQQAAVAEAGRHLEVIAAAAAARMLDASQAAEQARVELGERREELVVLEAAFVAPPEEALILAADIASRQENLDVLRRALGGITVRAHISSERVQITALEARLATAREQAALMLLVEAAERRSLELQAQRAKVAVDGATLAVQCTDLEARLAGLAEQEQRLAAAREATSAATTRRQEAAERHAAALAGVAAIRGQIEQLEALRPPLAEVSVTLTGLAQDQADWHLIGRGCGKGGLQALAIDEAGPEIAGVVNHLLLECHGPRWTFGLATQVEKADGKGVKNRFEPLIFDAGEPRDRVSGGEGAILDVAVRLALAIFNGRHSGRRYQVIWLDEAAQAVGVEHSAAYIRMLRLAMELGGFEQILIISHQTEVQAMADWVIRVADRAIESIECLTGSPARHEKVRAVSR